MTGWRLITALGLSVGAFACSGGVSPATGAFASTGKALVSADGLAAYWSFDEVQGSVCAPNTVPATDRSGNGNDATLNGAVRSDLTVPPVPTMGPGSCALNLGGPDVPDYPAAFHDADAPDSPTLDQAGNFTLSTWVHPEEIRDFQNVVSKETSAGSTNYNLHTMGVDPSTTPGRYLHHVPFFAVTFTDQAALYAAFLADPSAVVAVTGGSAACDAGGCYVVGDSKMDFNWHHVAAAYQASTHTLSVYVDGVLDAQASFASTGTVANNDADLRIGARGTANPMAWEGRLDEIRLYSQALSPEAIAALADYHNFHVTAWPNGTISKAGGTHTVGARITPALSQIPLNFTVSGSNSESETLATNGYGKAFFTYTDTATGNVDHITAWIDANANGMLDGDGTQPGDDPQATVTQYWVNLVSPDYKYCTLSPNQSFQNFVVRDGVLYGSEIKWSPTGTSAVVCLYFANVAEGNVSITAPAFHVFYTPADKAGATFTDDGFALTLAENTDLLGHVNFTNIYRFKNNVLNAHLTMTFTRDSTQYSLPIDIAFR